MPSLDIYCFGMVVLFLFSEKNWWRDTPPRSPDMVEREQQVNTLIAEMEGTVILQRIAQQLRAMLDRDPKRRPQNADDCLFELLPEYRDI